MSFDITARIIFVKNYFFCVLPSPTVKFYNKIDMISFNINTNIFFLNFSNSSDINSVSI